MAHVDIRTYIDTDWTDAVVKNGSPVYISYDANSTNVVDSATGCVIYSTKRTHRHKIRAEAFIRLNKLSVVNSPEA
jgi:hypothetical protein